MKIRLAWAILILLSALLAVGCDESKEVRITSDPSGAEISVDGVSLGKTPLSVKVGKDTAFALNSWNVGGNHFNNIVTLAATITSPEKIVRTKTFDANNTSIPDEIFFNMKPSPAAPTH